MAKKKYTESKAGFKRRMEAKDLWTEALAYREAEVKRLLAINPTWGKTEARQAAWELTFKQYPMTAADEASKDLPPSKRVATTNKNKSARSPITEALARTAYDDGGAAGRDNAPKGAWVTAMCDCVAKKDEAERGEPIDDVKWVYENLVVPGPEIDPETCPSVGAIGLLLESQRDYRWFYTTYGVKLLPTKAQSQGDDWFEGDVGKVETLAKMVLEAHELSALEISSDETEVAIAAG